MNSSMTAVSAALAMANSWNNLLCAPSSGQLGHHAVPEAVCRASAGPEAPKRQDLQHGAVFYTVRGAHSSLVCAIVCIQRPGDSVHTSWTDHFICSLTTAALMKLATITCSIAICFLCNLPCTCCERLCRTAVLMIPNDQPVFYWVQGFPWFRKGKSIPCAKYQIISGGPQKKKAKDPEEGRPATPPPVDKDRAEKMIDEQAENIIKVKRSS